MNIHEFQAKQLFRQYQVPVPAGNIARTAAEAGRIATQLGGYPIILKAQVHAGGRGRGGGVRLAHSAAEVEATADKMLGMHLITPQTGPQGKRVTTLLVEQGVAIRQELYLAMLIDRSTAGIVIMASRAGGMDIEEVAAQRPETIVTVPVNPLTGVRSFHGRQIACSLKIPQPVRKKFIALLTRLYALFVEYDCSLLEINPLVLTPADEIISLDVKIDIDSNSLFRHPDIVAMRDLAEEDPAEAQAAALNLNYIHLTGNVGNMVNGAGLAMATMDLIKQAGAEPANFLDVGGGADVAMVKSGFTIIAGDPAVKVIFINIFGGILRCDVLAQGVVQAARETGIAVPVVVRMEGTNVKEGRRILAQSGLNLTTVEDLREAKVTIAALVDDGATVQTPPRKL
jgi:succinyl-CoA synthetase beta subunit